MKAFKSVVSYVGIMGILFMIFQACSNASHKQELESGNNAVEEQAIIDSISENIEILKILKRVYPEYFSTAQLAGDTIIILNKKIIFDDRREKDFIELLDDSDIQDMFSMNYETNSLPGYLMDAGRSRCEYLFKNMYGASASEVKANLINIDWLGHTVWFNKKNGGADSLQAIAKEIQSRPNLRKYIKPSGTFNWRKVRGANRLSAHSYGIAIDIGVDNSNYWLWDNPRANEFDSIKYKNRLPHELVEIFERHGFIWGGRWYHYDTMHFEFRPEIIEFSKFSNQKQKNNKGGQANDN